MFVVTPPPWPMQSFERRLALLEARHLVGGALHWTTGGLRISDAPRGGPGRATRLAFASLVKSGRHVVPTQQSRLEQSTNSMGRKSTTHALHGLHPYKGKFYPQLARSLINVCGVRAGDTVLDPFAGCGTSMLEAALLGVQGVGLDTNPLAVLVSNTKLRLIGYSAARLRKELSPLRSIRMASAPRDEYLRSWFPEENFRYLGSLLLAIGSLDGQLAADAAKVVLSSVLRMASYQDPKQLRVYRRPEEDEIPDLSVLFAKALARLFDDVAAMQAVDSDWEYARRRRSAVMPGDARQLTQILKRRHIRRIDAIVTSPPYASALPYIDTDRLSLRALGLIPGKSQRSLEVLQIGNREISDAHRLRLENALESDALEWAPRALRVLLRETLESAKSPSAGFRRKRTPVLLYRYFYDMRSVLRESATVLRARGRLAVVVGDNTVAGTEGPIPVRTADILITMAKGLGFGVEAKLSKSLTSYDARDTVHHRNAMRREFVVLLQRHTRSN